MSLPEWWPRQRRTMIFKNCGPEVAADGVDHREPIRATLSSRKDISGALGAPEGAVKE